jgi:glutamate--cysteine ligase
LILQVRLKRFLEMRGADGGPWRLICALPALWVGLIYDAQAQAEALDLISTWTQDDRDYLRNEVPRLGLATPFKGGTVQDVALKVLAIAQGGLERRGYDEAAFLKQLHVIAESGMSPSSHLLEMYNGPWGQTLDGLWTKYMY